MEKIDIEYEKMQFLVFFVIESQTVLITGDYGTPQDRAPFA